MSPNQSAPGHRGASTMTNRFYHGPKVLVVLLLTLVVPGTTAHADALVSSDYDRGVITRIHQGVFQLGVSQTFIMTYVNDNDTSSFRANIIQTLAMRLFIRDNIAVSFQPSLVYRKAGEVRDLGFQGVVWGNYYFRLGKSVFLTPGVGAGVFRGQRDIPIDDVNILRSNILGLVAGFEIPLVLFATHSFSVKAGPEFVLTAGGSTPDMGESGSYFHLDGAFKVGVDYSF